MLLSTTTLAAIYLLQTLAFAVLILLRIWQVGWRPVETTFLAAQIFLLHVFAIFLALEMYDSGVFVHWPEWLPAVLLAPLAASATVLFREAGFGGHDAVAASPIPKPVRTRSWIGWGLFGLAWGFFSALGVLQAAPYTMPGSFFLPYFPCDMAVGVGSLLLYLVVTVTGMRAELHKINRTIAKWEKK